MRTGNNNNERPRVETFAPRFRRRFVELSKRACNDGGQTYTTCCRGSGAIFWAVQSTSRRQKNVAKIPENKRGREGGQRSFGTISTQGGRKKERKGPTQQRKPNNSVLPFIPAKEPHLKQAYKGLPKKQETNHAQRAGELPSLDTHSCNKKLRTPTTHASK